MNDRIKLLAEQAGFSTWVLNPSKETMSDTPELLEKFAELIAQETIVDVYRRYLDICREEDITVQVARYVKEHFGAEE